MKTGYKVLCIFLCAALGCFSFINLILPDKTFSERENRYLSKLPSLNFQDVADGTYSEKFTEYMDDQFVFRTKLTEIHQHIQYFLGKTEIDGVYVCTDGSLTPAIKPWDSDENRITKNIKAVNEFMKSLSLEKANKTVMVIPTAGAVYPGVLPKNAPLIDEAAIEKQIKNTVDGARVIDVTDVFKSVDSRLFYRTDHHWESCGALIAYKLFNPDSFVENSMLPETVSNNFCGTLGNKVLFSEERDSITLYGKDKEITSVCDGKEKSLYCFDALKTASQYDVFLGGNYGEVNLTGSGNGKLLIIKDSFANSFVPFALEDFQKVDMLDLRYFRGDVSEYFKNGEYTDVLVLYGIESFISDTNIVKLK